MVYYLLQLYAVSVFFVLSVVLCGVYFIFLAIGISLLLFCYGLLLGVVDYGLKGFFFFGR